MNKRQAKKNQKNKFANLQKGYGIIIGNVAKDSQGVNHGFNNGEIVKVLSKNVYSEFHSCVNENGLLQYVEDKFIVIKE